MPRRTEVASTQAGGKKPPKRPTRARPRKVPRLPRRQLTLPAGYLADGSGVATLRDVLSPNVATIDGANLTDAHRADLALLRIEAQPELAIAGQGRVIDKAAALEEVRQGTRLGRILTNVEHRAIDFLRETSELQRRQRKLGRRRPTKADLKTKSRSKKLAARRRG